MTIGYPADTGSESGGGFLATGTLAVPANTTQQRFNTVSVVNTRKAQYTLAIKGPTPPYATVRAYTFPLSPSNVRKTQTGMGNYYDVQGPAKTLGVTRLVDIYGNSPCMFTLEGTTGWKKHASDGFALTGLQSVIAIQALLDEYFKLNVQQMENGAKDLYKLEFHDFFTGDFWEVAFLGDQSIMQDERQPLLSRYSFKLIGISPAGLPPPPTADAVQTVLTTPPKQAQTKTATVVKKALDSTKGQTSAQILQGLFDQNVGP